MFYVFDVNNSIYKLKRVTQNFVYLINYNCFVVDL